MLYVATFIQRHLVKNLACIIITGQLINLLILDTYIHTDKLQKDTEQMIKLIPKIFVEGENRTHDLWYISLGN